MFAYPLHRTFLSWGSEHHYNDNGPYIFGGEVLSSFVFAIIIGVLIGTYSSLFIAGPLLILFKLRPDTFEADRQEAKVPAQASKA